MWDVTRTLKWLDSRLSTVENECWQHCSDSDDGGTDDGGADDGYIPDGPVESC